MKDVLEKHILLYIPKNTMKDKWNIPDLENKLNVDFHLNVPILDLLKIEPDLKSKEIIKKIIDFAKTDYENKERVIGSNNIRIIEKIIMLQTLDSLWKEHLSAVDYLRQGIHLRGYAQKDPKQEYKRESFNMFSNMLELLKYEVVSFLSKINLSYANKYMNANKHLITAPNNIKISRNALCVCGSRKKYKYCHGSL